MSQITVILPINDINEKIAPLFDAAIKSLQNSETKPDELLIVRCQCPEVEAFLSKYNFDGLNVRVVVNPGDANNFQSQINYGASQVSTEWFSILEYDDEYTPKWFTNVVKYQSYYPNVDVFLPIVTDTNAERQFMGFTNEPVWAANFSDEAGFLDEGSLLKFPNFQTSGAVYRTKAYLEYGGMKASMRLTFSYEFLLRMVYNDVKVMTIPKVGYVHTNMREGSLFWDYKFSATDKIDAPQANFWLETAKKEYYFTNDRKVTYA